MSWAALVEFMSSFSPRTLAYAGTAAALALVVQAAVLTTVVVNNQSGSSNIKLASHDTGQRAVVRFTANASLVRRDPVPGRQQGGRGAGPDPGRSL